VHCVLVCRQHNYIILFWKFLWPKERNVFSWDLMLPFIFCCLRFGGWFLLSVVLDILRSFGCISMFISSLPVMIGHVREIRHMYQFAETTSEDFLKVSIIWGPLQNSCLLFISMETIIDTKRTITLYDRANSYLQNTIFRHSHHWLCTFASV
jgi:hypothetical protein